MIEQGSPASTTLAFPRWGMHFWCRMLRGAFQRAIMFSLLRLIYRLRVTGKEHLRGLTRPVLFAANHNLPLDNALIIKAMPSQWRRWLAIAADAEAWRRPYWAIINPLLGNGFPFSREGAIRASLDNLGRILDNGWSVLIYPEGTLTVGGPIQPFKSGAGLIALEARIPVIPLRVLIHRMGFPRQFPLLPRGNIEVRFGKPLTFLPGTDYQEAARAIEDAVKEL